MNNYLCQKCNVSVQGNSLPNASGCPSSGNHNWYNLGSVGTHDYQCKKCQTHIKSNSLPNASCCHSSGNHNWYKLT